MSTHIQEAFLKGAHVLAFRVSKVPNLDLEKMFHHLEDAYDSLVVSSELHPIKHLHGIVVCRNHPEDSPSLCLEDHKVALRAMIKVLYPTAKGNKNLYTSVCRDINQCFKYTLKEGDYLYKGIAISYVQRMFRLSTPKDSLNDKLRENEEKLLMKEIEYDDFKINYIQIKIDHNQNLYVNHIRSYFNRFRLKSGHDTIHDFLTVMEL